MALADDMNLIADTPQGFHALIYHLTNYLLLHRIKINEAHTVSVVDLYHRWYAYLSTFESRSKVLK